MDDKSRGLYQKYKVERTDGKPLEDCVVLELKDPLARAALWTWVSEVEKYGYKQLARDTEAKLIDYAKRE